MGENLYRILGVSSDADKEEIKRAYRKIVKEHHPDLNEGCSSEYLIRAQNAYDTLCNDRKRTEYDRESGPQGNEWDFRGRTARAERKNRREWSERRRRTLHLEMVLSPREALFGGPYTIPIPVEKGCPHCEGLPYWEQFFCGVCGGFAKVRKNEEVTIQVPENVQSGDIIRYGLEKIGLNGVDLQITFAVSPLF
jgi:DnaJ-class molecular chaperone